MINFGKSPGGGKSMVRATRSESRHEKFPRIVLVTCGPVERGDLEYLMRALSEKGITASIGAGTAVPATAFDDARQQYRGEFFLEIARQVPGEQVLAVTNYDLYADNLNFIFGLAEPGGRAAVISLCRLRAGADEETFYRRVMKEAIHELGHTWGLSHCQNPRCVMHFSNSLKDTDLKETEWCQSCQRKL